MMKIAVAKKNPYNHPNSFKNNISTTNKIIIIIIIPNKNEEKKMKKNISSINDEWQWENFPAAYY